MEEAEYKGKLLRLFREIMLLAKTPFGLTINEMAAKVGVTYRTIYRDLELLEQVGFLPVSVGKGRYVIRGFDAEVQKFEKNLQFSAEEAGVLAQALASIPEGNPLKKAITEKILAFSGMEDVLKVIVKTDISHNMERLATAIRDRKQVMLHNYHSANSSSIKSRRVEPYAFSTNGIFLKGFEHGQNANKTYKIERIEEVMILQEGWKFEPFHERETKPDIFGINGDQPNRVRLRMSMRAAHLLKEEYPLSAPLIYKESHKQYLFEGECNGFGALGRFVLGLIDEVEVLEPQALLDYIDERISNRRLVSF